MASVDDLFRKPGVPSKRKLSAVQDPTEVYKSAKLSSNGSGSRHAREPDEDPEDDPSNEGDYGPDLPPGVDDFNDDDEDDEGRFFGGGLSKEEAEALDYIDEQDGAAGTGPAAIDAAWLRKTALSLEKRMNKNAGLRAKFATDPQKFIASEADLDDEIKSLSIVSEHPELYGDFVRLGCAANLAALLSHENTDIAIDVLEIIGELTDDDVAAEDEQWDTLVDALVEIDLVDLLVSNFSRLDEEEESDRNGVYHGLKVLENLCSRKAIADKLGGHTELLQWLLKRAQQKEKPVSQNKQYAAEILAILSQASAKSRSTTCSLDGVDAMLQLVASYRLRDPEKGGDEEEYMENLFEALTCLVDDPQGKEKFVEAEGIELCLLMLKEGHMSKQPALRLLDHAVGGTSGGPVCQKLVDAGGLKGIFTLFMKKNDGRTVQHLLAIFSSMLRSLPAESAERIRTLAKFVEKDYEKLEKLGKLRKQLEARVFQEDARIRAERSAQEDLDEEELAVMELEWLDRRLDAGLFSLQMADVVLSWLVAEDSGAKKAILGLLGQDGLVKLKASLTEQAAAMDRKEEEDAEKQDMLNALIECLG